LVNFSKTIGAEYLATGHYAKIENLGSHRVIRRAADGHKDQTYFMFSTPKAALPHLLFPNGDYSKTEIRKIAEEMDLPVWQKPDSQEICFIPDQDHGKFVEERESTIDQKTGGNFVNDDGEVVSAHRGIHHYTIGQRRGLSIAHSHRLYVSHIDGKTGTITVSDKSRCYGQQLRAASANWMLPVKKQFSAKIKIRNNHFPAEAIVTIESDQSFRVLFNQPQFAITPGQGVAVYQNDILMGGGWIE
jgi:tRNA-specific 2-thiouridylase